MKNIILGLGNPILSDDRIGIYLAERLNADWGSVLRDCDIKVTAVSGMYLIDELIGYKKAIIIDSIKTHKLPAGTVSILTLENFKAGNCSLLHQLDIATGFALAKRAGLSVPEALYFLAVEVVDNVTFSKSFSRLIDELKEKIYEDLKNKIQYVLEENIYEQRYIERDS